jgi:hypothetical protein
MKANVATCPVNAPVDGLVQPTSRQNNRFLAWSKEESRQRNIPWQYFPDAPDGKLNALRIRDVYTQQRDALDRLTD